MNVLDELRARGLIAQMTHEKEIEELFASERKIIFYIGFDPTADSVHIGSYIPLVVASHLQRAGHIPIILFGGGTAIIGDPSGKNEMRKMLSIDDIKHNVECFKKQFSTLVDFSDNKAIALDNGDWLTALNYVDFIKEVGVHFSVNKMLAAECYKQRMAKGLSFFELNYMLMQSYDFLYLNRNHKCIMQIGGDDQWSNIIGGVELIRRADKGEAYGMTLGLLLKSDGEKMGKTASGALWLDPNKTSPYEFFQYYRNVDDADVIKFMKQLTFLSLEEIAQYEGLEGSQLNAVKERLAFEITKLIHGEQAATDALNATKQIFSGEQNTENMPQVYIDKGDFTDGTITVIDILARAKIAPSKAEARRLIEQGGVLLNNEKVTATAQTVSIDDFLNDIVIKKGKKNFYKININ